MPICSQCERERFEDRQADIQAELLYKIAETKNGVCEFCGQYFAESTRKVQRLGTEWLGQLVKFTEKGVCPSCFHDQLDKGRIRDWGREDWNYWGQERLRAVRTSQEAHELLSELREGSDELIRRIFERLERLRETEATEREEQARIEASERKERERIEASERKELERQEAREDEATRREVEAKRREQNAQEAAEQLKGGLFGVLIGLYTGFVPACVVGLVIELIWGIAGSWSVLFTSFIVCLLAWVCLMVFVGASTANNPSIGSY